ncbi:MAG: DNA repair protein RadA [Treponemataceae bacterium]|nr:DNA repair protein RadA [Treponemataceae bacterium]
MAKKNGSTVYKCSSCGYSQPRWLGRCPECGEWNSLEECIVDSNAVTPAGRGSSVVEKARPVPLSSVDSAGDARFVIGLAEFDRVLGGGATKRSAVLIGGEPGIGKSTLLIQSAACMANGSRRDSGGSADAVLPVHPGRVLYVSGEESAAQIKARAGRLGLSSEGIEVLCTMRLEDVLDALDAVNPVFVIVDSIQTVYSAEAGIVPGTVNQLKYCANELVSWVKERDAVLVMTAHVTKEGAIAGPKTLEHMVDTVISFERNNEDVRFLHARKNRFGSVDELGIFNMTENGLEAVLSPVTMFLTERRETQPAGVACAAVFEGNRVFLVEIQALTAPAKAAVSRVYSDKVDSARVSRIAAILEKRAGSKFFGQDVYINVAGGIRLSESAVDAALAVAMYSARTDTAVPVGTAIVGELSLAGEIRAVSKIKQRAKTAANLGFSRIFAPEADGRDGCTKVSDLKGLIQKVFNS